MRDFRGDFGRVRKGYEKGTQPIVFGTVFVVIEFVCFFGILVMLGAAREESSVGDFLASVA